MKTLFKISPLKLAIFLAINGHAAISFAQSCNGSPNPLTIGTPCTNLSITQDKSAVNIDAAVTATAGQYPIYVAPNSGSITLDSVVISSGNSVSITDNSRDAFRIGSNASVTNLTNNGIISNGGNGNALDVVNRNSFLGTLTNNGVISGGKGVLIGGPVNTIINTGSIAGSSGAIYLTTATADLRNLTNSGSIYSAGSNAILVTGGGIGTITNTAALGTTATGIFGGGSADIYNQGQIEVLNNAQKNLSITGNLPTNYNIIIKSPISYGGLTGASLSAGTQTSFGIDSRSIIPVNTTTYSSVLVGFSAGNINPSTTSGTFGAGALVTTAWLLYNPSGGTSWDLLTTKTVNPAFTVAGSSAGTAVASVLAGQASNPTLQSNGVSIGAAVSGLTAAQAQNLSQVHAEGYSSNMTIGLEQMAHITNTVMDRIHAPMSASPSTKVYQDDEGRYIWADAAAVKGTVNNYNNLAGFGYNLYDIIIGGDIKRSKDGGFGVFAGTGSTSMTESQQVTQNFNTNNFYAGLYGARNFAEQVKLSGALGYMYGNTNANRSAPNVGDLVGGNALAHLNPMAYMQLPS